MNQETIKFVCYLLKEEEWHSEIKSWINSCLERYPYYDLIYKEIRDYFGDSLFEDAPFPPEVLDQVNVDEVIKWLVEYFDNSLTSWEIELLKECKAA